MLRLEALFPVLDVVLAATLSAWITAFATKESTRDAICAMRVRAERVRMGAMFLVVGMFVNVASTAAFLAGVADTSTVLDFVAYPFWIAGAIALASATWTERPAALSGGVEA